MANREAYLQELNELAATVVMGWREANGHIYMDCVEFEEGGVYEGMDEDDDAATSKWQPCQNEKQAWMLVDKVLAEKVDRDGVPILRFYMYYGGTIWDNMWDTWFGVPECDPPGSWWVRDMERSVALTKVAILASGGELPEQVEG
jgi:hypothetical protein